MAAWQLTQQTQELKCLHTSNHCCYHCFAVIRKRKTDRRRQREIPESLLCTYGATIDTGWGVAILGFSPLFYIDVGWSKFVLHSSVCRQREEDREAILRHKKKKKKNGEEKKKKKTTTNNGEWEQREADLQRAQLHVTHIHTQSWAWLPIEHIHMARWHTDAQNRHTERNAHAWVCVAHILHAGTHTYTHTHTHAHTRSVPAAPHRRTVCPSR